LLARRRVPAGGPSKSPTRSGDGGARSDRALGAFDRAAQAAVDYYARKNS